MQMNITTPQDAVQRVKPGGTRRPTQQPQPGTAQQATRAKAGPESTRKSRHYGAGF